MVSASEPVEYGGHSMVDRLRAVLVRRPDAAFSVEDPDCWNYTSRPDLRRARGEHDRLVSMLRASGAEIVYHDCDHPRLADAIYVFDPVLITDRGSVVLSMGKALRRGEETAMRERLESLGIPTLFSIEEPGHVEGGDLLWLDRSTLAAGVGFRTDRGGVRQLRNGLEPLGVEVLPVELPYHGGPSACLHLLSLISLVDHDLAVAYPPLLSVPFWKELERRGIDIVEVPAAELESMGPNVLALSPRNCLMLAGNPVTKQRLESAGCTVSTYLGNEISRKAEGGPTCLTLPILRRG